MQDEQRFEHHRHNHVSRAACIGTVRRAPFGQAPEDLVVAVLDSGAPPSGELLDYCRIVERISVDANGRLARLDDSSDNLGHATSVISAMTRVASSLSVISVKVFRDSLMTSQRCIASGIDFALDAGAGIVNLSLGFGGTTVHGSLARALNRALAKDIVIVASVGLGQASAIPEFAQGILAASASNSLSPWCYRTDKTFRNRVLAFSVSDRGLHSDIAFGSSYATATTTGLVAAAFPAIQAGRRSAFEVLGIHQCTCELEIAHGLARNHRS